VEKRQHKLFGGPDPSTKRNAPYTAVDDFDHGEERPKQKPGKPRSGNDQACDPSTVHSKQVMAR
jgi:hypothetical protein